MILMIPYNANWSSATMKIRCIKVIHVTVIDTSVYKVKNFPAFQEDSQYIDRPVIKSTVKSVVGLNQPLLISSMVWINMVHWFYSFQNSVDWKNIHISTWHQQTFIISNRKLDGAQCKRQAIHLLTSYTQWRMVLVVPYKANWSSTTKKIKWIRFINVTVIDTSVYKVRDWLPTFLQGLVACGGQFPGYQQAGFRQ